MNSRMLVGWFCAVLVGAFFFPDRVTAQIERVDGYDGYKFGMTIDQAKQVKPSAKQTRCEYVNVTICLEYATKISIFPATVAVQFKGATPLLSRILLTIKSLPEPVVRHPCREVGKEVLKLLIAKYGDSPLIKDHTATWTSPGGGSVSLLALCVGEAGGINVITYEPTSPL
jgi:hypothetical protein